VVNALILVVCVIKCSATRPILHDINIYTPVSILMSVMCVRRHSYNETIL